jgi:hypothetical protein
MTVQFFGLNRGDFKPDPHGKRRPLRDDPGTQADAPTRRTAHDCAWAFTRFMIAAAKQDVVGWRQPAIGNLQGSEIDIPIIYIHTHMCTLDWIELLRAHGGAALNVLYGSDYPYNFGDMVGCLARVNVLPDRQARQIAGKNAERIFRI